MLKPTYAVRPASVTNLLCVSFLFCFGGCAHRQAVLRSDPQLVTGELKNGLTYVIRSNSKPSSRLELRLVVDAGSVLEEEDQQGLAHFVEHMAFNGTKNFEKQELVNYLESLGIQFGPDLNAYTGFDETVYKLQVPTFDMDVVTRGLQILRDWADGIAFDPEEIEKERGVVIEEWRSRRGAGQRIWDQHIPVLYSNSQYAVRLPIGKKAILEDFRPERLKAFYKRWYGPENMCVVAVGDVDAVSLEEQIRELFSGLRPTASFQRRTQQFIPDHQDTYFSIVSDPEAARSSIGAYFKLEAQPTRTMGDYRETVAASLWTGMFNQRLEEFLQKKEPPFLAAFSYKAPFVRNHDFVALNAQVKEHGWLTGLKTLLTEAHRVKQFGFTATELARTKKEILREISQRYHERASTESAVHARDYIKRVLHDEILFGIEDEVQWHQELLPKITLDEVNALTDQWLTEENRVVLVTGPEEKQAPLPSEEQIAGLFKRVQQTKIEPYQDDVLPGALLPQEIAGGHIIDEKQEEALEITHWTLSNGARVIVKPTTFKQDEILFTAFSPGGHSLVHDNRFVQASSAAEVIQEAGIGRFSKTQLQKKLSGKLIELTPLISELKEGLSGSSSPDDIEVFLQLIHLYFTAPREDLESFEAYRARTQEDLVRRLAQPEAFFQDKVVSVLSNLHPRRTPWTPDVVQDMDHKGSTQIYRERFSNAGDFTFVFVGLIEPEELKPLIEKYIGSLPGREARERWRDLEVPPPTPQDRYVVRKGLEEKSVVHLAFFGPFSWSYKARLEMQALLKILRIRLRETVREALGGTYHVSVYPEMKHYPRGEFVVHIAFGCAPEQVDVLMDTVYEEISTLQQGPITEQELTKVRQGMLRQRESALETNSFWQYVLEFYTWHKENPNVILTFEKDVAGLTQEKLIRTAQQTFNFDSMIEFVLRPKEDFVSHPSAPQ